MFEMVYVNIIEMNTEEVIKKLSCRSMREAIRVERGVNINLDHENYYTSIYDPNEDK